MFRAGVGVKAFQVAIKQIGFRGGAHEDFQDFQSERTYYLKQSGNLLLSLSCMKSIVSKSILALTLLLAGAYLNQAFRNYSARGPSPANSPAVNNNPPDASPAVEKAPAERASQQASLEIQDTKAPDRELLRLRGENAALKSQILSLKNDQNEAATRKALEHRLGRTDLKIAETPGQPFQRNTYFPAALIQDVGNDTAPAALQSFIAAMTRGDYQAAIKLSPAQAQESLQNLADKQLLGKYVTSDSDGIKIDTFSETATESEFVAEVDFGEGKPPVRAHFYTTNEFGAWKVLPNVAIEGSGN